MASRKVRVIGAFHHRVEEIYYATLLHVGRWVTSLHRGLQALFELRSIVVVFLLPGYDALVDGSLRLSGRLLAFSVHPGVIETDLMRHLPQTLFDTMREAIKRDGVEEKTVEQGAATSVWAATAPELTQHGGSYLADCQIAKPVTSEDPRNGHAPWAYDVEGAKRLFLVSETLTSVRFP